LGAFEINTGKDHLERVRSGQEGAAAAKRHFNIAKGHLEPLCGANVSLTDPIGIKAKDFLQELSRLRRRYQ